MTEPRGIRNHNPGNLRWNPAPSQQWQGLADPPHDTGGMCVFVSPLYGLRALFIDVLGDWREGKRTLAKLLSEFAPPSENDTARYITFVARNMGVGKDDDLDLRARATLISLGASIVCFENGKQPYPLALVAEAADLASRRPKAPAPPPPLPALP